MNQILRIRILSLIDPERPHVGYILIETDETSGAQGPVLGLYEVTVTQDLGSLMNKLEGSDRAHYELVRRIRAEPLTAADVDRHLREKNRKAPPNDGNPQGNIAAIPFDECRRVAKLVATYARALAAEGGFDGETIATLARDYAAHEWNRRHLAGRL